MPLGFFVFWVASLTFAVRLNEEDALEVQLPRFVADVTRIGKVDATVGTDGEVVGAV